jgi:hypothetical protein
MFMQDDGSITSAATKNPAVGYLHADGQVRYHPLDNAGARLATVTFDELVPRYTPPPPANDNGSTPRVVGLCGPAGSGKSTVAQYLVDNFGYTRVRFAGPLKAMSRAVGLTDAQIEGDLKEVPSALLCGRTPRYFMQRLGTEFGRDLIGEDFWVGLWARDARDVLDAGGKVVADDCRFENEVATVRELGGQIGLLRGRGGLAAAHASESFVPPDPDFVLDNARSPTDLYFQLATWLRHAA